MPVFQNDMKTRNLILLAFFILSIPTSFGQTWDEIIKITASDPGSHDRFGESVAIEGNYAMLGAPNDDDGGSGTGSVYVFERDDDDDLWIQTQKLNHSDPEVSDWFGQDISISGNYAVISTRYTDGAGSQSGSAYIFERDEDGLWSEIQKLTASDAAAGDRFGSSVSMDNDYLIVGASEANDNTGSAYMFERNEEGLWIEVQEITSSDAASADWFGWSVTIDGEYAIVGANYNDDEGTHSGSAYVFERDIDGVWIETQKLAAFDTGIYDQFGCHVSISGNYAIIGALRSYEDGLQSGAAYIFERDDEGLWTETQKLNASDAAAHDWFGHQVKIDENYAVIGALNNDDAGSQSGSAYIFKQGDDGIWIEVEKLTASDAAGSDLFGFSVDISDNHAIIGAGGNDDSGTNTGSAYIFQGCVDMTIEASTTEVCEGDEVVLEATSETGETVSWSGDVENGISFMPPLGLTTYTVTGGEEDCEFQVIINVLEAPVVEITASDFIICEGEEITLSAGGAVTYFWEDGVVDGEAFEPPVGETTYTVIGTADNDCENEASMLITVNVLPEVIAIADNEEVCAGEEITLSGSGATTYEWDEGAIDGIAFEPAIGETTYTVIGTDDNDCQNTDFIDITVNALPEVTATSDNEEVCAGEEITLSGSGATTYEWDEGAIDGIAFEPAIGETTYTVIGTDANDCSAMNSITITVFENPIVTIDPLEDDHVCLETAVLVLSASPAGGIFSGTGVTGTDFDPDAAGIGTHILYYFFENDEGCSATDSVTVTVVDCLGLDDYNQMAFKVYPNPFSDFATVKFNQKFSEAHQIVIYDMLGKEVFRETNLTGSEYIVTKESIRIGVYTLFLLENNQRVFASKLIIQ